MARQSQRRRLGIRAALIAAGVAAMAGGYVAQKQIAEARAEDAIAKLRERLPDDVRFAYRDLDASLITQSATFVDAEWQRGDRTLRAAELTIGDVARTDDGELRTGHIDARDVTGRHSDGLHIAADRIALIDLRTNPQGDALRALGGANLDGLLLRGESGELRAADLELKGATARRLDRLSAGRVTLRGLSRDGKDREVFRDVKLEGLDLSAVPPPARWDAVEAGGIAEIARNLGYDALRVGRAELHRAGKRRLLVRGLKSSQTRKGDRRIWQTGVDRIAVATTQETPPLLRILGENGTVRWHFSGQQVYDSAAGTLTFRKMAVALAEKGRLSGSIRLTGLPDRVDGFMPGRASLAQAKLASLDLTFADTGILDPALNALAERQGVSRNELVDRRLGAIARQARGASRSLQDSVESVRRFLKKGGKLRVTMKPARAVAMSEAMMAFAIRPVRTAEAMNLRIARK